MQHSKYLQKIQFTAIILPCTKQTFLKVCATVPVPQIRQAKETECQRCRKYSVPTPTTKWAIECNPVYDEKCKTRYTGFKLWLNIGL